MSTSKQTADIQERLSCKLDYKQEAFLITAGLSTYQAGKLQEAEDKIIIFNQFTNKNILVYVNLSDQSYGRTSGSDEAIKIANLKHHSQSIRHEEAPSNLGQALGQHCGNLKTPILVYRKHWHDFDMNYRWCKCAILAMPHVRFGDYEKWESCLQRSALTFRQLSRRSYNLGVATSRIWAS